MKFRVARWHLSGAMFLLMASSAAEPSMIVAPHGAGRDADLAGIVVAAPDDGTSTLMINPAGVVSQARNEAMIAILPLTLEVHYQNPITGYDGKGSKDLFSLGFWYGLGEINGWSLGDRKSTRLNSSHIQKSRMPSSA